MSSAMHARSASMSPRPNAAYASWTTFTFSASISTSGNSYAPRRLPDWRSSVLRDPVAVVVPAPEGRSALQVHAAQPSVDPAEGHPVLSAAQDGPTGIRQGDRPVQQSTVRGSAAGH